MITNYINIKFYQSKKNKIDVFILSLAQRLFSAIYWGQFGPFMMDGRDNIAIKHKIRYQLKTKQKIQQNIN